FGRSDVFCGQAHAMHMGGLSLDRDAVMREFRPNEVCWGLMDQLWADDALSWSQLQLMLRGALEQGKTTQARRTAAIMFNGKQMQDYTALMENPRRWLGQQSAPAGAQEQIGRAACRQGGEREER